MRLAPGCVKLRQRQGMWDLRSVLSCGMVMFEERTTKCDAGENVWIMNRYFLQWIWCWLTWAVHVYCLQHGKHCKRQCRKHASLLWGYVRHHWQMAAAMTTWFSLALYVLSRCFSSFRSVMRILYTSSCNALTCCNQLDSIRHILGTTVETEYILEFLPVTTQW